MSDQKEHLKTSRSVYAVNMLLHLMVYQCGRTEGSAVAAAGSTINVTVGDSVLFPVSPEGNHSYKVSLLFKLNLLVSWTSLSNLSQRHDQYKYRIENQADGSMHLNNVQFSDSGLYNITTDYTSGDYKPPHYSSFHLQVFEQVSKPNVTAECRRNNISLSCSSIRGSEVIYSWETLPPRGNNCCVHLGQTMEIHPLPPSENTTYTCTAQNPVSRATSDPIDLGVCSTLPGLLQPQVTLSVLCAALSALLLFGAILFFYVKKKREQSETIQAETECPFTEEEPSAVPSIDPVYVTRICAGYLSSSS